MKASRQMEELRARLLSPKARIRTKDGAAQAILTELSSQRFIEVKVDEVAAPRFRQVTRGRAGAATTYRREDRIHIDLTWRVLEDRVAYVAKSDGMFPFITNCCGLTFARLARPLQVPAVRRYVIYSGVHAIGVSPWLGLGLVALSHPGASGSTANSKPSPITALRVRQRGETARRGHITPGTMRHPEVST